MYFTIETIEPSTTLSLDEAVNEFSFRSLSNKQPCDDPMDVVDAHQGMSGGSDGVSGRGATHSG